MTDSEEENTNNTSFDQDEEDEELVESEEEQEEEEEEENSEEEEEEVVKSSNKKRNRNSELKDDNNSKSKPQKPTKPEKPTKSQEKVKSTPTPTPPTTKNNNNSSRQQPSQQLSQTTTNNTVSPTITSSINNNNVTTTQSPTLSSSSQRSNQTQTSRLLITKIVMENFKSYAGIQEVGPFHKCFSSVVGPNGSGKSNVIDAMLFVFGYRAKQIRQNKVSELIHNSATHKNITSARVSVHFQDIIDLPGDEYEVVPGSDFIVTRTAHKSKESKYFVNDDQIKLEDLKVLLKKKGIDLDNNRFLILQGEVEQIAMMKPKGQTPHEEGLLEYLEDIIGSRRYLSEIEDTSKKVEEANEKRTEKLNRVKVSEKERESLEGARNEAEEYIKKEHELIEQRSILCQISRRRPEQEKEKLQQQKAELSTKLNKEKEQHESITKELANSNAQIKSETAKYEEINKQLTKSKSEYSSYERKTVKYKEELKHLKTKIKKNNAVLEEEKKKQAEFERNSTIYNQDIKRYEKELESLPKRLAEEEKSLEKMMNSFKGEIAELQLQMEEKQKELMPWSNKHSEWKSKVDIQASELEVLSRDLKSGTQKLDEAEEALKEAKNIIATRDSDIAKAKKEYSASDSKMKKLAAQLAEQKTLEEKLYREAVETRGKAEEIRSNLSENNSRSTVMDRLMKMKENNKIPGIHGRLGDLGAIDQKYDVAISTACPSLDNIVVDSTATAEACVELLRKENLGRATFIILDKITYLEQHTAAIKTPENVPRLFDLIKMKNKEHATAFYYAMRDTLVANDLEIASRIAYGSQRYRVVTLKGELIDMSGAMSGGGNRVMRGLMGSKLSGDPKEDRKNLASLEKQLAQLDQDLQACKKEIVSIENEIQQTIKRKSDLEVELKKMEMDIKASVQKQEELSKTIPTLKAQVKVSSQKQDKLDQIKVNLATDQKELDKVQKKVDKLEEAIQEIQNSIINIGGPTLKAQKSRVDSLQQQIDSTQHSITKANVQIKTLEKSMEKSKKNSKENEKEKVENEQEYQEIEAKFTKLEKDAEGLVEAFNALQEKAEEKEKEIEDMRKDADKLKKIVDKARKVEVEIQMQIEDVEKNLIAIQQETTKFARRLDDLNRKKSGILKLVDEEENDEPLKIFTDEEIEAYEEQEEEIKANIATLEKELENLKASLNLNAIKEYKKKDQEYQTRQKEFDQAHQDRENLKNRYDTLRKNRLDEFMAGFSIITMKLKEMYQMITLGGDAELELVDTLDPFSEGIVFSVRPPKKSWKNISNLSGGEKTLSSLALVFALHHYKPTPLYVMDEIDAALDYKNVSIVAHYIKERTKNAQFIIISLRNYMFEQADRLVGIYKTDNCTKSVTINPHFFNNTTTTATK
eukprot:gene4814-6000_t